MDNRKKRALLLGLSFMLSTLGLFLLMAGLGILGSIPRWAGIAGFAVTAVLSFAACFFAARMR